MDNSFNDKMADDTARTAAENDIPKPRAKLLRTTFHYMQLRDPNTGETLPYRYWISERADGSVRNNHDFRRDGALNAYVRWQMTQEGKIHPYASDGEVHSVLTAAVTDELLPEYNDRWDAAHARFTIDEPSGRPDEVHDYSGKE